MRTRPIGTPLTDEEAATVARFEMAVAAPESFLSRLRELLDDSVLMHTGRSIGDLASARVAADVMEFLRGDQ